MRRNDYFSWHLLGKAATPWDHNDPVYPVNSCFMQVFDRIKIILFVIIFPWSCTKFPEYPMSFPGSENAPNIPAFPGLWPPWLCTYGLLDWLLVKVLHPTRHIICHFRDALPSLCLNQYWENKMKTRRITIEIYNKPRLTRITKFTTAQNN